MLHLQVLLTYLLGLGFAYILFSVARAISRKILKILTIKQEKYEVIKLPAKSKLDSIVDIISQAMEDGDISSIEFHLKVLREEKKYRKLKADIRKQAKIKVKMINK